MDKIERNTKEKKIREDMQPFAKVTMDFYRKLLGTDKDNYPMMEGELTEEQRESKVPIGTKGYYRMYRWECFECEQVGRKLPYSEMQTEAIKHYEQTGHKMKERGGVFPKSELYSK